MQEEPIVAKAVNRLCGGYSPAGVRFGVVGRLAMIMLLTVASGCPAEPPAPPEAGTAVDAIRLDHSAFDRLLRQHVDADGWVDYEGLHEDTGVLDGYIGSLALIPLDRLGRDEKLALLINAYNAFTLRLILDYYPITSIKDIPGGKRWKARRWRVGTDTWSLDDIEHKQIRPVFAEPRVHFALVCAAIGCPPLRNEAYVADRLDEQLDAQTRYAHQHGRWLQFDAGQNVVKLTRLYKWYGGDFQDKAGSNLAFASTYSASLQQALEAGRSITTQWLDYDWRLNSQVNSE